MEKKSKRGGWGKRTENFTIRFDKNDYADLMRTEKLATAQQVADFLMKQYQNTKLMGTPTLERNMTFEEKGGGKVLVQDLTAPRTIDTLAAAQRLQKIRQPKNKQ